jgi:hypothetical protein
MTIVSAFGLSFDLHHDISRQGSKYNNSSVINTIKTLCSTAMIFLTEILGQVADHAQRYRLVLKYIPPTNSFETASGVDVCANGCTECSREEF